MSDEIGTRVKKVRLRKGISQEQFGEIIGIKKAAVSKIENGENSLSKGNLLAICRQFNVNKEWLINGNGEMFTPKSKEDEIRISMKTLFLLILILRKFKENSYLL